MNRLIWKRFFGMMLLLGGFEAVGQQPVNLTPLPSAKDNQTLLWEVTGNGLLAPNYFLGTMHILCPEDAFLSESVIRILDRSKAVYFEIELDDLGQLMGALKAMLMRNDTTLTDLLTPEELARLQLAFKEKLPIPLPFAVLQRMKPMMLSGMLAEQMLPCKAGAGTEMLISEEAKKRKLPIKGLETAAFQAGLFDSIPYALQARELLKSLEDTSGSSQVTQRMIDAFKQQNLEALNTLMGSEEGGMAGFEDILVYGRNRNWVEAFANIAREGTFLFAVGAGHLPGEQGVLSLLKKKGYTLRPIVNTIVAP